MNFPEWQLPQKICFLHKNSFPKIKKNWQNKISLSEFMCSTANTFDFSIKSLYIPLVAVMKEAQVYNDF